jgi:hypothetical protein
LSSRDAIAEERGWIAPPRPRFRPDRRSDPKAGEPILLKAEPILLKAKSILPGAKSILPEAESISPEAGPILLKAGPIPPSGEPIFLGGESIQTSGEPIFPSGVRVTAGGGGWPKPGTNRLAQEWAHPEAPGQARRASVYRPQQVRTP